MGLKTGWRTILALSAMTMGIDQPARAGVPYVTPGSTYLQDFNSFPTDVTQNAALQPTPYADGWQDDVDPNVSSEDDISIPGWHLFHPGTGAGAESGFNNRQRLRIGSGSSTIGSFWAFGPSGITNTERALGSLGSTNTAANGEDMFMGLQLINTTGQTLHSFTLTFDGEQWRRGAGTGPETLIFDYSVVASDDLWTIPGSTIFTPVPTLNFTGPSDVAGTLDGNGAGRVNNITATVSGFNWEPNGELWLRWADLQRADAADDALGIDDLEFSASTAGTGSVEIISVQTGLASSAATWSDNQPPASGAKYRVATGHTVTLDSAFAGDYLRAGSGATINVNSGGSGADVRFLFMDAGSTLTDSVSGDLAIGAFNDPADLGAFVLNQAQTINADANSDVTINLAVYGAQDLTVNSNGPGSDLWLANLERHSGVVKFNGTGDNVVMFNDQALNRLEMNSTGANSLQFSHQGATGGGVIVFNQSGRIEHLTNSNGSRLVQKDTLIANANVTLDLSQTYAGPTSGGDERRLAFTATSSLEGAGSITVVGTPSNPTSGDITLNEFEVGSSGEPGAVAVDSYSGTISTQDYVNVELRHSLPAARIIVNDNARVDTGHQVIATSRVIALGDVQVNGGGTFEVGFEQVQNGTGNSGTGNHVGHVNLVDTTGRTGSLTLTNGVLSNPADINSEPLGSMLVMQVNGKGTNQFDTLSAKSVALDGVLKVLINPTSSIVGNINATPPVAGTPNPIYTPALGDVIPLITAGSGASLSADFDDSNAVDAADLTVWKDNFGPGAGADADSDGDSDGNDFLLWQRQLGQTATGGITGTFDSVVFLDVDNNTIVAGHPDTSPAALVDSAGLIGGTGLKFQIQYTSTAVNLVVVSAAGLAVVPEPSGAMLAALSLAMLASFRRRRS